MPRGIPLWPLVSVSTFALIQSQGAHSAIIVYYIFRILKALSVVFGEDVTPWTVAFGQSCLLLDLEFLSVRSGLALPPLANTFDQGCSHSTNASEPQT